MPLCLLPNIIMGSRKGTPQAIRGLPNTYWRRLFHFFFLLFVFACFFFFFFMSGELSCDTARSSGVLPCRIRQTITVMAFISHNGNATWHNTHKLPTVQLGWMHHRLGYACKQRAIKVSGSRVNCMASLLPVNTLCRRWMQCRNWISEIRRSNKGHFASASSIAHVHAQV